MQRKLQTPEYKDIDERHRIKMIENETCILAVADLDLYYSSLDKALLRYHGIKIEEINKIIQELWTLTYKGKRTYQCAIILYYSPYTSNSNF